MLFKLFNKNDNIFCQPIKVFYQTDVLLSTRSEKDTNRPVTRQSQRFNKHLKGIVEVSMLFCHITKG